MKLVNLRLARRERIDFQYPQQSVRGGTYGHIVLWQRVECRSMQGVPLTLLGVRVALRRKHETG